jgi:8-oxo-dGTP pyrophosphatase MutT (NUDIX family)
VDGKSQSKATVPADFFLRAQAPLKPSDAVAALLVLEDGRYVMQLRDAIPNIFYPDHWGCFGGAIDPGERAYEALQRELREELEFDLGSAREFTRLDFDWRSVGHQRTSRTYYEVSVTEAAWRRFVLHEGAAMQAFTAPQLLSGVKVTPYDSFAVWMHFSKDRLAAGAARGDRWEQSHTTPY